MSKLSEAEMSDEMRKGERVIACRLIGWMIVRMRL